MNRIFMAMLGCTSCVVACGSESSSEGTSSGGAAGEVSGSASKVSGSSGGEASDPSSSPLNLNLPSGGASGEPLEGGEICDSIALDASSTPPRVVFVQDLSSSMRGQWQPLRSAMVSIAQNHGERLQLGMIPFSSTYIDHLSDIQAETDEWFTEFFAQNDNDCTVSESSIILPTLGGAEAVVDVYDSVIPERMVGGTPTYQAMEVADKVLVDDAPDDGSRGYAILVTDGAPNCASPSGDRIADVEDAITALAGAGVDTYVVGYRYDGEALDLWARAGNTEGYYDADDTAELDAAISGILTDIVPCEYELSAPVDDPRYVRVTLDDEDREYDNEDDGWTLSEDRQSVVLVGEACSDLRSSGNHSLAVVVECDIVEIIK